MNAGHQQRLKALREQPLPTHRRGHRLHPTQSHDYSTLSHILQIDPAQQTALVEPYVTFEMLVDQTLKHGLIPPVVPEFKKITVGGAIMGAALESSSFRYGQVSDCALGYECLLSDGSLLWVSPTQHADLFYGLSGSYGTLARLTAILLRLLPAKPFVTLFPLKKETLAFTFQGDFAEALFLPDHTFLHLEAEQTEHLSAPPLRLNRPLSPSFYQAVLDNKHPSLSLSLKDYLFRYDRGSFWMGHYATHWRVLLAMLRRRYRFIPCPAVRGWRRLLLCSTHRLYQWLHATPLPHFEELLCIHDVYIPTQNLLPMLAFIVQKIGLFPLWLCPVKGTHTPQFLSPHFGQEQWVNIGCYGIPQRSSAKEASIALENQILSFGGRKMLYSLIYYNKERFEQLYGDQRYLQLRKRYDADHRLPSLYEKLAHREL